MYFLLTHLRNEICFILLSWNHFTMKKLENDSHVQNSIGSGTKLRFKYEAWLYANTLYWWSDYIGL